MKRSRGFTLTDLIVVIAVMSLLLAQFFPNIFKSREAARRTASANNMKQLALAALTYHDAMKKFPALCDKPLLLEQVAASTDPKSAAQYSWIVTLLPYMEEGNIYNQIATQSERRKLPAFTDTIIGSNGRHISTIDIATLRAPDTAEGTFAKAKEYAVLSGTDDDKKPFGVAITNYVATPATHLELLRTDPTSANGLIVPGKGTTIRQVKDGMSRTILLAESREADYCSWYDAGSTWVVALPSAVLELDDAQKAAPNAAVEEFRKKDDATKVHPLNYGPTEKDKTLVYLEKAKWANAGPRTWGPSSPRNDDVVNHAMGDGAVVALNSDVDAKVYIALVSRNGGETGDEIDEALTGKKKPKSKAPPEDAKK
ncbi:MAG: DUF1559 domain-containing protein [Planctomycetota bacterium]|nr:DUF1559 domain-containing protein [Planctomycetota bacterium]